ncbi:MAG: ribonuclease [Gammaproteobacteria bacterium]|nr:ribonuclease [Gammaproteobacteria bacterium]
MILRKKFITVLLFGLLLLNGVDSAAFAADICGSYVPTTGPHNTELRRFANNLKLNYVDAFVNIVNHIEHYGHLPSCYLSKQKARKQGWSPGKSLWKIRPGHAIGGNRFGNREQRLPQRYNRHYTEADLDYDGHKRGARRLVFVRNRPNQGLIWVTTDHYKSFHRIPKP